MKTKLLSAFLILLSSDSIFAQCTQHLSDSLIARWDFNGDASDLSGNGHNGKVHGTKPTTDRCNSNAAYYFKGARLNQYIQVHNSKDLSLANTNYSICAWINATITAGIIISKRTGTHLHSGYIFYIADDQKLGFDIGGGSSDGIVMTSSGIVADTTWKFVVVTYIKKSGMFKMYINGVLDTVYKHIASPTKTNSVLKIGNDTYYTSTTSRDYEFDGKIDDIKMYNRLLDTCEITALYNENCNSLNHISLKPALNNKVNNAELSEINKNPMSIYPNPAKNTIQIILPRSVSDNAYIMMYDFNGKKIIEQKCSQNNSYQQLNVTKVSSGIYKIAIIQNNEIINNGTVVISK